ncbi:molybdopterin-dependent oxidoreductase [Dongia sedimenti]|uniref:Molybdopterin-dependent oxidoreductase n=1 Tax=Dongia sedimenti TaxID=3064282 RepID=A0ABU0YLD5_9PROT|nr:molybdopterin-dependent oxidoreductase [Rhodospirillaceae bacterium R-7]
MFILRTGLLAVFLLFSWSGLAPAQEQPETLPLAIGTEGYKVTVADLEKMPQTRIVTATPFLPGTATFEGVLLRELLKAAKLTAPSLVMTALNDYRVEVPASDAENYDVIVAYKVDGKYMRVRDKGPFWLIYPLDQHPELRNEQTATKMIWQIKAIDGE